MIFPLNNYAANNALAVSAFSADISNNYAKNIPEHTLTKCILCFGACTVGKHRARGGWVRLVVVALMRGTVVHRRQIHRAMWVRGSETSFFTTGQQSQARNRCSRHAREQSR